MPERPLIVGVGNEWRRDDGVGPWVASEIARLGLPAAVHGGDGTGLIDLFASHPALLVVDATRSNASPGTCVEFDAAARPLPAGLFHYSTHRFGLAEAVETARALDGLPRRLAVYGIEGEDFTAGKGLSAAVHAAAARLVEQIRTQAARL